MEYSVGGFADNELLYQTSVIEDVPRPMSTLSSSHGVAVDEFEKPEMGS